MKQQKTNQDTAQRRIHGRLAAVLLLSAVPTFGAGCMVGQDPGTETELISGDEQAAYWGRVSAQVVIDWDNIAHLTAINHDGLQDPLPHARARAMMHLAIHDAVNGVIPKYDEYAFDGRDVQASPIAAAAAAAHGVLVALYPGQESSLDSDLSASLSGLPNDGLVAGVELGQASAQAILAARANDGSDQFGAYVPGSEPGDYQYVAPFTFAYRPAWGDMTPFGLTSPDQFRSPPHPSLDSAAYASNYEEVKAYGAATGSTRTADQTFYADFWYEFSEVTWPHVAQLLWEQRKDKDMDLWKTARVFALNSMALMDTYIAGWDGKFHYALWRPVTAIQAGDTDGNVATPPDADWQSHCVNPPVPDYPSTHAALGKASSVILARNFGDDSSFTLSTSTAIPAGATRSFTSLSAAAEENADSRVACGIHFRFATDAGLVLGEQVANYIADNYLQPLP